MKETYEEFLKKIKKVSGPRKHKVSNSSGIAAAILFYTKNRPKSSEYVLSRHQYSEIIDKMNLLVVDRFLKDKSFRFPCGLGDLIIVKNKTSTFIDSNNNLVCTKPIDRAQTLRLWYDDDECFEKKTLVRTDSDYVFRIRYSKAKVRSKNAIYYFLKPGRALKQKLKDKILTDKTFDTYERRKVN